MHESDGEDLSGWWILGPRAMYRGRTRVRFNADRGQWESIYYQEWPTLEDLPWRPNDMTIRTNTGNGFWQRAPLDALEVSDGI